jgi:hypothetical protein
MNPEVFRHTTRN